MRNLIIIALTALLVIGGIFLPELLMGDGSAPEIELDYQQVSITSETSSDYAWRMEQISEYYFGDAADLMATFIPLSSYGEEEEVIAEHFYRETEELNRSGVISQDVVELVLSCEDYRISYYYLFNSKSVNGLRILEMSLQVGKGTVTLSMDADSGRLAQIAVYDQKGLQFVPMGSNWYDVLRGYADYLGLSSSALPTVPEEGSGEETVRTFYEQSTMDRLAARITGSGSSWLEVRALQRDYMITVCVYRGGK